MTPQDDTLAERIAALVAERLAAITPPTRYLDVDGAAAYLVCKRQRIYDLVSAGTLTASRDGRRLLFTREALDAVLTHDQPLQPQCAISCPQHAAEERQAATAGARRRDGSAPVPAPNLPPERPAR